MQEENALTQQPLIESEAVSWWSWRPGIKPLHAFLFCGLLSMLAIFLLANGVMTLIAGILDSTGTPLQVRGIVTEHSRGLLGSPQLVLHLEQAGFPTTITLVVSHETSQDLANGNAVIVDYATHQHIPYALESGGHHYLLPGASVSGNLLQILALLLFGLVLLPYPTLLSFWGWRDLRTGQRCQRSGVVVALRAARQTTTRTPGLIPRTTHIWHGVAVQVENSTTTSEILTFGIRQELYEQLQRGNRAEITYSPHLRHLYKLKVLYSYAR